jgi:SAM-dependent methyltransferase
VSVAPAYDPRRSADAFPEGYDRHFWHQARQRLVLDAVRRHGSSRVLDIGCGPGAYVRALRAAGIDAEGCDPGHAGVPTLAPGHVFTGQGLDRMDEGRLADVDTALLLDVIEHLAEPVAFLQDVRSRLPRLRTLILTVPARRELWSALDRAAGHHRRYTRASLRAVLDEAGFAVRELAYAFRLLYLPALAFTWMPRRRRRIVPPASPRLHGAAGRLLAAERRLLPDALPGTSLLCVASPGRGTGGASS